MTDENQIEDQDVELHDEVTEDEVMKWQLTIQKMLKLSQSQV